MDDGEKLRIVGRDEAPDFDDLESFLVDSDSFIDGLRTELTAIPGGFDRRFDRYGVPNQLFGQLPDDFYGLIGRVVAVSALVETQLGDLVATLADTVQSTFAGQDGGRAVKTARRLLLFPLAARPSVSYAMAAQLNDLVDRIEEAMRERNDIVHSVWPGASLENARGWRPAPKAQRLNDVEWTKWYETTEVGLVQFIATLSGIVDELFLAHQRLEGFPRLTWRPPSR